MYEDKQLDRIQALNLAFAGREQRFLDQLAEGKRREEQMAAQLLSIEEQARRERADMAQKHKDELRGLREQCARREAALLEKTDRSAKEAAANLLYLQRVLERTHSTLSWRATSPLRKLRSIFSSRDDLSLLGNPAQTTWPPAMATSAGEGARLAPAPGEVEVFQEAHPAAESAFRLATPRGEAENIPADLTLQEMLALDGELFFERAYHGLLGRGPDNAELGECRGLLGKGFPKIHILALLRSSDEGNRYCAEIEGLGDAMKSLNRVAASLGEILALQDYHFLCCAYRTFLGRAPDTDGLSHYLDRLRSGSPKIEIVANLRLSLEGQARSVTIPGLEKALGRYDRTKWLNPLAKIGSLIAHPIQSISRARGGKGSPRAGTDSASPLAPSIPEGFEQLPARARTVYFQLKAAASRNNTKS
ncbi:MAG: DUF4214 domain-containing protein [Syntrophobacteraceae bacterium]|nr:DUF4214 domain-containing protein [Syntrophobacteraceae bacterium]